EYDAITVERGVTHDTDFHDWANKVWNYGQKLGNEVSLKDFRKSITIELLNEAGQLAIAYNVFRCWVSEYQAQADLDANGNSILIQHLKIENEGWEIDSSVGEPTEKSLP
ncbi:MAG TPA: phage tail protein, partial [Kofleriaceae bacterium]|nr:phage tail protein [Kofleriaceae bacterium]